MSAVTQTLDTVQSVTQSGYKWGWETEIEMDLAPKGLNEDTIRLISARKEEPAWLLEWRLKAFATRRFERADAAIGKDAVDAAIKEAREEFRTKVVKDDRRWGIFENGTQEEWDAGVERLKDRGVLNAAGALTEGGRALRAEVEATTDRLASDVWDTMDEPSRAQLFGRLRRLATLLEGPDGIFYPNPVGVTRPV